MDHFGGVLTGLLDEMTSFGRAVAAGDFFAGCPAVSGDAFVVADLGWPDRLTVGLDLDRFFSCALTHFSGCLCLAAARRALALDVYSLIQPH